MLTGLCVPLRKAGHTLPDRVSGVLRMRPFSALLHLSPLEFTGTQQHGKSQVRASSLVSATGQSQGRISSGMANSNLPR